MHKIIQSPLNYTGGKFKLLWQITPHFPQHIETFVDMFCGGFNVGININARKVIFNDSNFKLLFLYKTFKSLGSETVFSMINELIDKYELSRSFENGYDFYDCNSSNGLGDYNKEKFIYTKMENYPDHTC